METFHDGKGSHSATLHPTSRDVICKIATVKLTLKASPDATYCDCVFLNLLPSLPFLPLCVAILFLFERICLAESLVLFA